MYSTIGKKQPINVQYTINSEAHKIHNVLGRGSGATLPYSARDLSLVLISGASCDNVGFLQMLGFPPMLRRRAHLWFGWLCRLCGLLVEPGARV